MGSKMTVETHSKARSAVYPFSNVKRFNVPDDKVTWSSKFNGYLPQEYTAPVVKDKPVWADDESVKNIKFNKVDGKVNRTSFTGGYKFSEDGLPLNPIGRTGIMGRGVLGKWGPNHAADPVVTRWKRRNGKIISNPKSSKQILQFVAIKRKDTGAWAVPGGMVDDGESVSATLKREFGEEALNSLDMSNEKRKGIEKHINTLFRGGKKIYSGYVDDPRNTDNAWMETVAINFHDGNGDSVAMLPLSAGDDAGAVAWVDISRCLHLYASHSAIIKKVAELHNCDW